LVLFLRLFVAHLHSFRLPAEQTQLSPLFSLAARRVQVMDFDPVPTVRQDEELGTLVCLVFGCIYKRQQFWKIVFKFSQRLTAVNFWWKTLNLP
jgi:hypothetical protein